MTNVKHGNNDGGGDRTHRSIVIGTATSTAFVITLLALLVVMK
jgi:hypothetical protein